MNKYLRATATYDDGHGAGKTANAVSTHAVQAAPATNDAPVFSEATASRSVAENAVPGIDIGTPVTATDAATDTLTYSLGSDDDEASFDIVPGSGQLQTKAPLDFETTPSYTVTVTATDPSGALDTITVTITVTNVDEDGTVTLSNVQPQVGTALTAMLEDPDGDPTSVTWQWGRGDTSDGSFDNISNAPSYTPVAADVGKFLRATANYTDPQGGNKTARGVPVNEVQAAPDGPNSAPVFSSNTAIRSVAEDAIEGSNVGTPVIATDADNDNLTYSLAETDTAPLSIVQESGQLQTTAELNFEGTRSHTVTVTAADPSKASASITVTINVGNVDEPGTVSISPSQFQVGTELTASLADPDGTISGVTWQWDQAGTNDIYTNVGSNASYTPTAADVDKFLRATVTYTDGEGTGKTAEAVSNKVEAAPPTNSDSAFPSSELGARTVAENTEAGENIGAPVTATDANTGDTLTYSLGGTDGASFGIDTSTGQLRVGASTTLDHETKPSYTVTVSVRDSKNADGNADTVDDDSIEVTITVTNEDEDGTVTLSPGQPQVGTELTATLEDPDGTVSNTTWLWESSANGSTGWATVTGATDTVTTSIYTPVDADFNKYLRATATYTDGHGSSKSADAVSANPVNAAPVFSEPSATRAVDENTPTGTNFDTPVTATDADTLNYKLGGTDAASFRIVDTSGQLQTEAALDFEGKSSYDVTVIATDASGATASIPVTITVNNLEEQGTVKLTLLQPQVGTEQTTTLEDPDGTLSRVSWQWARGDSASGPFTNVSSGADPGSYTPVAADVGKFLRATATYDDGHGAGKSASAVSTNAVQLAPATNDAPVFTAPTASRSVAENAEPGTDIGTAVTAADSDNDTLTYKLGADDDAASFDIVPGTGQLQTEAALDFESDKKSYTVVVTATDPSGALDTIMVTITVTNVDEAGTVMLKNVQPQVGTALTAMLTDLDGDPSNVTWQWGRRDISTGPFSDVSSAHSYTPVAADVGKFLRATATYTDPQGPGKTAHGVSTHAVQAAPDGPNSAPVFLAASASRSVAEDATMEANVGTPVKATDADGEALTYSLPATDTAPFSIDQVSGQLKTTAALNFEDTPSYTVTVTAADPSNASASITVTISVGNVDEREPYLYLQPSPRLIPR